MHNSSKDNAYVRIATPLSVEALHDFCNNLERLYRINPQLEFSEWRKIAHNHYYLQANNLSNAQKISTEFYIEENTDGFIIHYDHGLKASTQVKIEKNATGSALTLIDDYSRFSESERTERLSEVDHSLESWGKALYRYLLQWQRWKWFPPYRWYMRRVWQPMKPSARRIAYMLIIITSFEFLAFLLIVYLF